MAGGKSTRMGRDKSLLPIGQIPLIQYVIDQLGLYFDKILISSNNPEFKVRFKETVIPDAELGKGPVVGLMTAIQHSSTDANFVQACDIPETNTRLLKELLSPSEGYDAVVPQDASGRIEPLFAVYKKSSLPAMEHVMQHENARATRIIRHCQSRLVKMDEEMAIQNLNTLEDYRRFTSAKNNIVDP